MNDTQKKLLSGALKSAVSSATGMILSLNVVDAEHFSVTTLGGWKHLGIAIVVSVVVAEARFWKQWSDSGSGA